MQLVQFSLLENLLLGGAFAWVVRLGAPLLMRTEPDLALQPYDLQIATRGVRTTFGSLACRDFVADDGDVVVERLRATGAIVAGHYQDARVLNAAAAFDPARPAAARRAGV